MSDQKKTQDETLTERMAMAAWHVCSLDEDVAPMLFAAIRKDAHEEIEQMLMAYHTLTDDAEVEALIRAIRAGGEAG